MFVEVFFRLATNLLKLIMIFVFILQLLWQSLSLLTMPLE